ncbi:VOC family protein [bacterium]|nr:VOC family protein [bacterium]MBU1025411.1 VOC family protein [bacterium]
MRINHLAIAVKDIAQARDMWSKLLKMNPPEIHVLEERGVKACPFYTENVLLEIVEPIDESSPVWKFVHEKGGGLHHIAIESDDIEADIELGKANGFRFIGDSPVDGLDNSKIIFFHPKSVGILLELVQPS